ncbi:MAG: hypothetical protein EA401_01875 [Planctomycetota bacterium]|nr:MAG: hypothetical protein EA401_01875 [Planctomycetota bacterium]
MKPDMRTSERKAWITAGVTLVVALVAWWIASDGGATTAAHTRAASAYENRIGPRPLAQQVAQQSQAIADTQEQIDELKAQTGVSRIAPFVKPRRDSGGYIAFLIRYLRQELQLRAQTFTIDERLGFNLLGTRPPPDHEADGWLNMLQMVTKALYLCSEAPGHIDEARIVSLTTTPIATGPAGRPALLHEYPFTLEVTGTLESISWLLVQLSSDERTQGNKDGDLRDWLVHIRRGVREAGYPVNEPEERSSIGPLIVRGFNIIGSRLEDHPISRLTVTFDLAGMHFLSDEERGEQRQQARPSTPRGSADQRSWTHRARP